MSPIGQPLGARAQTLNARFSKVPPPTDLTLRRFVSRSPGYVPLSFHFPECLHNSVHSRSDIVLVFRERGACVVVVEKGGSMSEPPHEGESPPAFTGLPGGGASSSSPSAAHSCAADTTTHDTYWGTAASNANAPSTSGLGPQPLPPAAAHLWRAQQQELLLGEDARRRR